MRLRFVSVGRQAAANFGRFGRGPCPAHDLKPHQSVLCVNWDVLPQIVLIRQARLCLGDSDFVSELSRDCKVCVVTIAAATAVGRFGHDITTLPVPPQKVLDGLVGAYP
jgi:hypothetical protein